MIGRALAFAAGLFLGACGAQAASVVLAPVPIQRFVDNNGDACTGCEIWTYAAGTTTKVATYTDSTGLTPNTNPIILNTRGEAGVWLAAGVYKISLSPATDSNPPAYTFPQSNPIWTIDNIPGSGSGQLTQLCAAASPIVADGYCVSGQVGPTAAQSIYNQSTFSPSATNFQSYDTVRGVVTAPALSTVNTITGLAGYALNDTVPIGQRSQTVSVLAIGDCAVAGSQCWGFDSIVSDNPTVGNTGITTGGAAKFLTNEFDLNISNAASFGNGLAIGGSALPTGVTLGFNGISIAKLWGAGGQGTGTSLFANGFIAADGCCAVGLTLGSSTEAATALAIGQPALFNYRDAAGVEQNITMIAADVGATLPSIPPSGSGSGTFFLGGTGLHNHLALVSGSLFLSPNQGLFSNNHAFLSGDGSALLAFGTSAPWTSIGIGNASSATTVAGSLVLPSLPGGVASKFLCVTAANIVITQASACQ